MVLPDYTEITMERRGLANATAEKCFEAGHSSEYAYAEAAKALTHAHPDLDKDDRDQFVRDAVNLWYGDPNHAYDD